MTNTKRRPAVTITQIPVVGYGDETRYEIKFLGTKIGEVYKVTEMVNTNIGPSRIGNYVGRTAWHFDAAGDTTISNSARSGRATRTDAITQLLMVNHYPGREHIAAKFAKAAR